MRGPGEGGEEPAGDLVLALGAWFEPGQAVGRPEPLVSHPPRLWIALHVVDTRPRAVAVVVHVVAGVVVSFAGAGVQMSGFALHQHFNHNDLYHVIQMFGLWLFWKGAREA